MLHQTLLGYTLAFILHYSSTIPTSPYFYIVLQHFTLPQHNKLHLALPLHSDTAHHISIASPTPPRLAFTFIDSPGSASSCITKQLSYTATLQSTMPTLKYTSPHNTITEAYITKPILDLLYSAFLHITRTPLFCLKFAIPLPFPDIQILQYLYRTLRCFTLP